MLTDAQIMDGETESIARSGNAVLLRLARVEARDGHGAHWPVLTPSGVAEGLSFVLAFSMADGRLAQPIDPASGLWQVPIPAEWADDNLLGQVHSDDFCGYRITFVVP